MTLALEEAIKAYLTADDGVSAIVEDRVHPMRLPEHAVIPAVTFHRVSANRLYTYDRFEDTDAWVSARVQFNCWAYTANEAMTLGEAVLLALSGYEGSIGGDLIGSSFAVNEIDTYEAPTKFHRRILDFQISYEDALAAGS